MIYTFICDYYISSPYLLVFGDDRVRGTQEQMILQVVLVRHRLGAWASWKNFIKLSDYGFLDYKLSF